MQLKTVRKAAVAAVSAAVSAAIVAFPDGFTDAEIGVIASAFVVAAFAVFHVPNAPKD